MADYRITVCIRNQFVIANADRFQAQQLAARVLSTVGVKVLWSCTNSGSSRFITIEVMARTPQDFKPTELAYALPFEGAHITLFYDRIRHAADPALEPDVLGYVLVHEIVHLIFRNDRHSATGIMKAHWSRQDYRRMQTKTLSFAVEDLKNFRAVLGK